MLICSYLDKYFDIPGETWELPQKLTMFNEFQLIVNFVGKSDCMSTDLPTFVLIYLSIINKNSSFVRTYTFRSKMSFVQLICDMLFNDVIV